MKLKLAKSFHGIYLNVPVLLEGVEVGVIRRHPRRAWKAGSANTYTFVANEAGAAKGMVTARRFPRLRDLLAELEGAKP